MKIATRLKLIGLSSACVVALLGALLMNTAQQMRAELDKNASADEVLNGVTALRYLTVEYVLRREARAHAQWQLRNQALTKLLERIPGFDNAEDEASLAALRRSHASVSKLFTLLVATRTQAGQNGTVPPQLESRLTGQITSKAQSMIVDALSLSERSRQGVVAAQQRQISAIALCGLAVFLLITGSTLWILRSLVGPLKQLQDGTNAVGAGDLDFRLGQHSRDELGELARAFDAMTERLRGTTVNRDVLAKANAALQDEVLVRQAAEQKTQSQLARLNLLHQITRSIGERQDLRSIFQVVIRSLEDQLPVDFCSIGLYDAAGYQLEISSVGLRSEALAHSFAFGEKACIPIDENGLSRCVRGQLVYEPDISDVAFPFPRRLAQGGLAALVLAPLLVENTVFGVLICAREAAHSFSSGECEFLRQLSEHVALAANQMQLYGALQRAYEDLRQSQKTAMQQERLRALGQMASGIAHDINNAISPVSLYTESLLETEPDLSERSRSCLEVIKRSIDDVAATVARMREFYRQRDAQASLRPVDANLLLQQVMDLTRARWSDMPQQRGIVIRMRTDFQDGLPAFPGIDNEIREALTNLIFNAVDAMPDGGTMTLRSSCPPAAPGATRLVHIEVSDTGAGMDEETRRRCLEPFFTTKGERGTGLGLAMVYGIIERHGAHIEIDTAPGRGSTFRLGFPLPADAIETGLAPLPPALRAGQRILVVDDDPLVLRALRSALEGDGHTVAAADGGQAGIDLFLAAHRRGEPFALVITDLGMPYVDGRKVAGAIKAVAPAIPIILLTGWGQRLASEGELPAHVDRVLGKPPKLAELRVALASCLCAQEGA